jgi:hypothetical protein
MNTLIYKRTHTGDPDESRIFGCEDCMGRIRRRNFDAVIGIGGMRPDYGHKDLAFKINWIGMHPSRAKPLKPSHRGPSLKFEPKHFRRWEGNGPDLVAYAPELFNHMFEGPKGPFRRHVMSESLSPEMQKEVENILKLIESLHWTKKQVSGFSHSAKCNSTESKMRRLGSGKCGTGSSKKLCGTGFLVQKCLE